MKLSTPQTAPSEPLETLTESSSARASEASWPRWFRYADGVMAGLVIALAFLLASFAARNSEVWLHLATGRLISQGQYTFGVDPYSFATAGRYWANPDWLFDLLEYQIYSRFGAVILVVLKAASIAFAAALLLTIRRKPYSLWPWVMVLMLALIAAAPRMLLAPASASIVCLSILLFLVLRRPGSASGWRLPAAVGVLFALWSNLDEWFFLGPLTMTVLLIGSAIQAWWKDSEDAEPALGPSANPRTLALALLVGTLACMVNPHHVHVWQLPLEVTHSTSMVSEPLFQRQILLGPLDSDFSDLASRGRNANGAAYLLLLVGGGLVLGLGGGRLRLGHLLLWLTFAVLSLRTVVAIPFFAIISVPLVAGQLNAAMARWARSGNSESRLRLGTFAGTLGRGAGILLLGMLLLLAWPGLLHPTQDYESDTPRVAWGIIPDPSMRALAEQIQAWRESGSLTPQERGIILSTPMGNYCAWFAPSEKVFVNTRYRFHEPELQAYTKLRSNVGTRADSNAPANIVEAEAILKPHGVSYVALFEPARLKTSNLSRLLKDENHWSLWSLAGRSAVLGWRASAEASQPSFTALKLDPFKSAFATITPAKADARPEVYQPRTWLDDLYPPVTAAPPQSDDASVWLDYKDYLTRRFRQSHETALWFSNTGKILDPLTPLVLGAGVANSRPPEDTALNILALRTAWQAVATNSDNPDAYVALFRAVSDPALIMDEPTRRSTMAFAMLEALRRVPPPGSSLPRGLGFAPVGVAGAVSELFTENSRPGFAEQNPEFMSLAGFQQVRSLASIRQFLILALQYAGDEKEGASTESPELTAQRKQWAAKVKDVEKALQAVNGQFEDFRAKNNKIRDGYLTARQLGLTERALQLLQDADLRKEFGENWPVIAVQQVALELILGRIHEADQHLNALEDAIRKGDIQRPDVRGASRRLSLMMANVVGNYRNAVAILDLMKPVNIGIPSEILRPYLPLGQFNIVLPMYQAGPALGSTGALLAGYQRSFILFSNLQLQRQLEADYRFERGMALFYAGDYAGAAEEFKRVNPPPPPGWSLPPTRQTGIAAYLLELMDLAKKNRPH